MSLGASQLSEHEAAIVDAMGRAHTYHVARAARAQRNGVDQPEHSDALPFTGIHVVLSRLFDIFINALVLLILLALALQGGTKP